MRRYLTIGEVATLLKMSTSKIRFYEKKGLIKPYKIDENGYRLYSFREIDILEGIGVFRKLGMPIEEMKQILNQEVDYDYLELLNNITDKLEMDIKSMTKTLNAANQLKKGYKTFMSAKPDLVSYEDRVLYVLDDDIRINKYEKEVYDFITYYDLDYTDYEYMFFTLVSEGINMLCVHNYKDEEKLKFMDKYILPAGKYFRLNLAIDEDALDEAFIKLESECKKEAYKPIGPKICIEDMNKYSYSRMKQHVTLQVRVE